MTTFSTLTAARRPRARRAGAHISPSSGVASPGRSPGSGEARRRHALARAGLLGGGRARADVSPERVPVGASRVRAVAPAAPDPGRGVDGRLRGVGPPGAGQHRARAGGRRAAMAAWPRRRRGSGDGRAALVGRAQLAPVDGPTQPVAIVQGNIPQAVKWDAAFRAETFEIYGQLTRAAAPGSRLVVWPEAAVPAYLRFEPGAMQWLIDLAAEVRRAASRGRARRGARGAPNPLPQQRLPRGCDGAPRSL